MTSSPSTYLLPGPPTLLGSKPILIKPSPPAILHPSIHQRPSLSTHVHPQMMKSMSPNDTFHPLTITTTTNGTSVLQANHNNNEDCSNGSNGHSLSQSMESINNIGLPDDEVK